MNDALRECLLNVRHRVAGRRLLPLCFDTVEALRAYGCESLLEGGNVRAEQLLLAARLCSLSGEQLEREGCAGVGLRGRLWMVRYALVAAGVAMLPASWVRARGWIQRFGMRRDVEAFADYVRDYAAAPSVAEPMQVGDVARDGGADVPALFARLTHVMIAYKGAITERRARSMPIGLLCHYAELARFHAGADVAFIDAEKMDAIDAALEKAEAAGAALNAKLEAERNGTR